MVNFLPQGCSVYIIHKKECQITVFLETIETHNIRMLQSRQGLSLPLEPAQENIIFCQVLMQDLHRQVRCAAQIPNLIDIGHSAAPEKGFHAELIEENLTNLSIQAVSVLLLITGFILLIVSSLCHDKY